jgi:hypothetical protein
VRTWGADVTQKLGKRFKASVGSDYTLYGFGPLGADERSHVRSVYLRVRFPLAESLSAELRTSWEKDDVETFHVLSLAVVLQF